MRLDDARLCLDCEEIHEEQECPACGSEAFAFLTRWIQSTSGAKPKRDRKAVAAVRTAPKSEHLAAWQQITEGSPDDNTSRGKKFFTRGLLGLAAMGIAGWAWSRTGGKADKENS